MRPFAFGRDIYSIYGGWCRRAFCEAFDIVAQQSLKEKHVPEIYATNIVGDAVPILISVYEQQIANYHLYLIRIGRSDGTLHPSKYSDIYDKLFFNPCCSMPGNMDMSLGRRAHTSAVLGGRCIVVAGGLMSENDLEAVSSVEYVDHFLLDNVPLLHPLPDFVFDQILLISTVLGVIMIAMTESTFCESCSCASIC